MASEAGPLTTTDLVSNNDIHLLASLPQAPLPPNHDFMTVTPECYGSNQQPHIATSVAGLTVASQNNLQSHLPLRPLQDHHHDNNSSKESTGGASSVVSAVYSPEYISL